MKFLNLDDIDKTIFELLRLKVVSLGYLPNILNSVNYEREKASLKANSEHGIIEIFGVASWQDRNLKTLSRFTIDRTSIRRGQIGGGATFDSELNGIIKTYKIPSSRNITYEIRFSTNSQYLELLSNEIISSCLGTNSQKLCLSERVGVGLLSFNLVYKGSQNISSYDFYERVFTYEAMNVTLENEVEELTENFVSIDSIDFKIKNNQTDVAQINV